eukprot:COSAG02_NODE_10213_length_1994_cov_2.878628_2_plen_255_part_00
MARRPNTTVYTYGYVNAYRCLDSVETGNVLHVVLQFSWPWLTKALQPMYCDAVFRTGWWYENAESSPWVSMQSALHTCLQTALEPIVGHYSSTRRLVIEGLVQRYSLFEADSTDLGAGSSREGTLLLGRLVLQLSHPHHQGPIVFPYLGRASSCAQYNCSRHQCPTLDGDARLAAWWQRYGYSISPAAGYINVPTVRPEHIDAFNRENEEYRKAHWSCAFAWLMLLLSVVVHAVHYCVTNDSESDGEEPSTMYS